MNMDKENTTIEYPIRYYGAVASVSTHLSILYERNDGSCGYASLCVCSRNEPEMDEGLSKIKFTDGEPKIVFECKEGFFSKKVKIKEIYLRR